LKRLRDTQAQLQLQRQAAVNAQNPTGSGQPTATQAS